MQDYYHAIDQDTLAQEIIAFAMSLNACLYVNQVAQNQVIASSIMPAYITPILNMNPGSFSELLTCPQTLQSALGAFIMLLKGEKLHSNEKLSKAHQALYDNRNLKQIVMYIHGALKLRKLLLKDSKKLAQLENRLQIIARFQQLQSEQGPAADQQLSKKLAALYLDIFGSLSFRIIIQGRQEALGDPSKVELIRCLLLGAIRFSVLWQQVGGRQWKLLLYRGKMLSTAESLYKGIQKLQENTPSNVIKIKP